MIFKFYEECSNNILGIYLQILFLVSKISAKVGIFKMLFDIQFNFNKFARMNKLKTTGERGKNDSND